ncbi:hypothetical protein C1645_816039 [Glomus cerebriforme]|uniref:Uncharacterized protein n=1 Tax=Glomus cerebriforme TaxID=658196 RepID=A0A397TG51_9GLOM|nr:hypothetical protein C1645_816039 [Glomus cerebriforme]
MPKKKFVNELTTDDLTLQSDNPENDDPSQSKFSNDSTLQSDNPEEFALLFSKIVKAEKEENKIFARKEEKNTQEVIRCYYFFGKALVDRFDHYKKLDNKERTAQALVNEEVKDQLSDKINNIDILTLKERTQKIYEFFNEIGEDKIQKVRSLSAVEISELSCDHIDYVLTELAKTTKRQNSANPETTSHEEKKEEIVIINEMN